MELTILGSGGCTCIPRPGCVYPVCVEAREKGIPYSRSGPSLFLHDINALFDTPEDIASQLNREGIQSIRHIFYTHWHPDHTLGMRVIEQLSMNFLTHHLNIPHRLKKIKVCAVPQVMDDLMNIQNKWGSFLKYYAENELISLTLLKENVPLRIASFRITPILSFYPSLHATLFIIEENDTKVVYAPSHCKPWEPLLTHPLLKNISVLIIGDILPHGPLKGCFEIPAGNTLHDETLSLDELTTIIETLGAESTFVVHIEEEWGKSYRDYARMEEHYAGYGIHFTHDGMKIMV